MRASARGGHCQACAAGTYKGALGSVPCTKCQAGTYSVSFAQSSAGTCSLCPNTTYSNMGSSEISQCICNLGYTGPDGQICVACPIGTFKDVNGSGACSLCAAGKYSVEQGKTSESTCTECGAHATSSADRSECVCTMGYTGPTTGPCEACGDHHYKSLNGSSPCLLCPPRAHTNGLTAQATCMCLPQFYGSGSFSIVFLLLSPSHSISSFRH